MPQPRWTTADLLDLEFLLQQDEGKDMALLSGALYRNFGPTFVTVYYFLFVAALLAVIFIDLHHQIIPDKISLPGIVIGFVGSFFNPLVTWQQAGLGILIGGGILYAVAAGYVLLTGSVIGGLSLLLQKKDSQTRIPFGPFLSLAALSWLFFQDSILAVWQWYLGAAHI